MCQGVYGRLGVCLCVCCCAACGRLCARVHLFVRAFMAGRACGCVCVAKCVQQVVCVCVPMPTHVLMTRKREHAGVCEWLHVLTELPDLTWERTLLGVVGARRVDAACGLA